jgi:exodeoxyribonuclease V alpha subunit
VTRGARVLRLGDKVMQLKNDYEREVYNGDVGIVSAVEEADRRLLVRFDDRDVVYEETDLDELTLAYATSIHKSQGSEYPAVVIPLVTQHYMMLQRNLLYTGITRAKKLLILAGSRRALAQAVRTRGAGRRHTALTHRLSPARPGQAAHP